MANESNRAEGNWDAQPIADRSAATAIVPVAALEYGTLPPPAGYQGRRLARVSWIAGLVAIALIPAGEGVGANKSFKLFVSFAMIFTAFGGMAAGVMALAGIRRWGREKVLVPALLGSLLNGILCALIGVGFYIALHARANAAAAQKQRMAQSAQVFQQGQHDAMVAGWIGGRSINGVEIGIVVTPPETPTAKTITSELSRPYTVAIMTVQNHAAQAVTIDTRKAMYYVDGKNAVPMDDPSDVLSHATQEREVLVKTFSAPKQVFPGKVEMFMLFFSPTMDFSHVKGIAVSLNGAGVMITGRIRTSAEKVTLLQRAAHVRGAQTEAAQSGSTTQP